jgi:hypothetical protein
MGTCLAELCGILKRQGFTIPAAGNFIAQHSFACEGFPIGKGRPDKDDLSKAAEFGLRVVGKIAKGSNDHLSIPRQRVHPNVCIRQHRGQGLRFDARTPSSGY